MVLVKKEKAYLFEATYTLTARMPSARCIRQVAEQMMVRDINKKGVREFAKEAARKGQVIVMQERKEPTRQR